ncbi:MAG: hypothetical protein AAF840_09025 [Bacteroidota bacterium]
MDILDVEGVWKSPLNGSIPDYQSNVTNWIGGYFADGDLKLSCQKEEQQLTCQLEVPVMFSGGFGSTALYDELLRISAGCLWIYQGGST